MLQGELPMLAISEGGTEKEIKEAYRILREAGFYVWGHPVEDLLHPRLALPRRVYNGVDEIRDFINEHMKDGKY